MGPCRLSVLYVLVCVCYSQAPNLSRFPHLTPSVIQGETFFFNLFFYFLLLSLQLTFDMRFTPEPPRTKCATDEFLAPVLLLLYRPWYLIGPVFCPLVPILLSPGFLAGQPLMDTLPTAHCPPLPPAAAPEQTWTSVRSAALRGGLSYSVALAPAFQII